MLSDTLVDLVEILKTDVVYYTTSSFANTYEQDVRDEVDDIINRMKTLSQKLDCSDFKGSYKYE